jgi:hypothetical protein
MTPVDALANVRAQIDAGRPCAALDALLAVIDDALWAGDWGAIDDLIRGAGTSLGKSGTLALLSFTKCERDRFPARAALIAAAEREWPGPSLERVR